MNIFPRSLQRHDMRVGNNIKKRCYKWVVGDPNSTFARFPNSLCNPIMVACYALQIFCSIFGLQTIYTNVNRLFI